MCFAPKHFGNLIAPEVKTSKKYNLLFVILLKTSFKDYKLYEKQRRFPDVLIVGASKCGGNVLKHYLHGNPYFVHSNVEEPHFFDNIVNFRKGPQSYLDIMPKVYPYHRVFESTPR